MISKPTRLLSALLFAVFVLAIPRTLFAQMFSQAFASSELTFDNVTITPASGTLEFLGPPWTARAFAHADNSLGESRDASAMQQGGIALAAVHVTYADGAGGANANNLLGFGKTTVDIPVCEDVFANAIGRGSIFNSFILTGGTGAVDVTFEADIFGELHVLTGPCGVEAITETIFTFDLFGRDSAGQVISTPILARTDRLAIFGPNQRDDRIIPRIRLTKTLRLLFTTNLTSPIIYDVNIEADSESRGRTVPEPSSAAAIVLGLGVLACWRRRRRADRA
jgi:hypothetical protein